MIAQRRIVPAGLNGAWVLPMALAAGLGGCAAFEKGAADTNMAIADVGEAIGAPWGGQRPVPPPDPGVTFARLADGAAPKDMLTVEPGNVWPAEEAPRATLANPDAALRGIPEYRGPAGLLPDPGAARDATPRDQRPPAQPRPSRGSSSPPPGPDPLARAAEPVPPAPIIPYQPPPRTQGQVITTPSGAPAVTTGGTPRSQSYLGPNGTPGVAQSSGGVTTLFGSDGTIRQVPTPR